MKFITTKQASVKWGITDRRIRTLLKEDRIEGAVFERNKWFIPENAKKPSEDKRAGRTFYAEIDRLKEQLDKTRPLTEGEVKRLNEQFAVDYTYNSNAIEGNTLTLNETAMVLQGVTIDQKPLKDHMEAVNHKEAFDYVVDLVKNKTEITESVIKTIHSLVLADMREDKGRYRRIDVRIAGATKTPPQPYLVEKKMEDLMIDYKLWKASKHIVEQVALFHLIFEGIHPFIDGNGRTGRLLNNLMFMQEGYPPINIKFKDRKKYYNAFESYFKNNNPKPMINLVKVLVKERLEEYLKILS
ncbi:MAG: Fic family protein [Clostridia bacterium]|nr:Fic family protein [Clostridia bacterium]